MPQPLENVHSRQAPIFHSCHGPRWPWGPPLSSRIRPGFAHKGSRRRWSRRRDTTTCAFAVSPTQRQSPVLVIMAAANASVGSVTHGLSGTRINADRERLHPIHTAAPRPKATQSVSPHVTYQSDSPTNPRKAPSWVAAPPLGRSAGTTKRNASWGTTRAWIFGVSVWPYGRMAVWMALPDQVVCRSLDLRHRRIDNSGHRLDNRSVHDLSPLPFSTPCRCMLRPFRSVSPRRFESNAGVGANRGKRVMLRP